MQRLQDANEQWNNDLSFVVFKYENGNVGGKKITGSPFATAAYPAAYAPISQAFPQQPTIIPQQQREGKSEQTRPPKIKGDNCHVPF